MVYVGYTPGYLGEVVTPAGQRRDIQLKVGDLTNHRFVYTLFEEGWKGLRTHKHAEAEAPV